MLLSPAVLAAQTTSTNRTRELKGPGGSIDNLQIAATGLQPGKTYRLMLIGGSDAQELILMKAGIDGVAIARTLGPLKHFFTASQTGAAMATLCFSRRNLLPNLSTRT
jgi:hypothetical protein